MIPVGPSFNPELLEAKELIKNKMNKTVLEIAKENAEDYLWIGYFPGSAAVITLLDMALSSKERWDVVFPTLEAFAESYPDCTLESFPYVVQAEGKRRFVERWVLEDLQRYTIIERLAQRFVKYKKDWVMDNDIEAMERWAKKYRESKGWPDPNTDELLKGVSGLTIIDVQYLQMRLGIRTVKPDNRLKLVLRNLDIKFKNDIELVLKAHEIADILGLDPLVFDQMFW
jgi:hypothetical protein